MRVAAEKHKARLSAELTRSRLRRNISSIEELKAHVKTAGKEDIKNASRPVGGDDIKLSEGQTAPTTLVRWVRINTLKTKLEEELQTTFAAYTVVDQLSEVTTNTIHIDKHVPDVVAVSRYCDLSKTAAYRDGHLILQDKASCFPAYMLNPKTGQGQCIDACAAPGNKTTHLAAILYEQIQGQASSQGHIHAFERDKARSIVLREMVSKAGATKHVSVHQMDFLTSDPSDEKWKDVSALLLDPSCSGSGMTGRDDRIRVTLPRTDLPNSAMTSSRKKRKRPLTDQTPKPESQEAEEPEAADETPPEILAARLSALSAFQLKILLHAFQFPKARKIVYSTCSVHAEENERVVMQALSRSCGQGLGWQILRRDKQVAGLRAWNVRGDIDACKVPLNESGRSILGSVTAHDIAEACIRCEKNTAEGTQGFFVAGFVRDCLQEDATDESEWEGILET